MDIIIIISITTVPETAGAAVGGGGDGGRTEIGAGDGTEEEEGCAVVLSGYLRWTTSLRASKTSDDMLDGRFRSFRSCFSIFQYEGRWSSPAAEARDSYSRTFL